MSAEVKEHLFAKELSFFCLKFNENQRDCGKLDENVQSPSWSDLVLQTYLGQFNRL